MSKTRVLTGGVSVSGHCPVSQNSPLNVPAAQKEPILSAVNLLGLIINRGRGVALWVALPPQWSGLRYLSNYWMARTDIHGPQGTNPTDVTAGTTVRTFLFLVKCRGHC